MGSKAVRVFQYIITVESDVPPQILLGQDLCGAIVTKLEKARQDLVSAAQLAKTYSLSVDTIRRRLSVINQGTEGKALYDPNLADSILRGSTSKRGRKRAN